MPPPKLEFPGFEKSGGENASHMDLGGGEQLYIYIYIFFFFFSFCGLVINQIESAESSRITTRITSVWGYSI